MLGVIRRRRVGIRFRSGRPVIAVAVMHEEMHERKGENNKEGQHAEQMRAMLGEEIEDRDGNTPQSTHCVTIRLRASLTGAMSQSLPILGEDAFRRTAPEVHA